jgi:homoserine dehydrogenase
MWSAPSPSWARCQVVNDARAVIANPDIDIVIELIGGYGIAKALVLEAIAAGKHVVTANKALAGRARHRNLCGGVGQGRDGGV